MSTHGPWVPGIPAGTKRPVAFTCYGLKDSSGNIVLPADYYSLKYLGPDRLLAGAIELTEDGYAVIDLHGNIVIPFGKYEIKPVELDRAGARVFLGSTAIWSEEYDSSSIHAAMYDWNGNAIFKYEDCQRISYVEDGFFILTANDGKKGIYEYGVGMTLPLGSSYKFITHYIYKNYNLFGVMNQDGLCGVIDKNGNQILPCAYEYVGAYRNGCFIISRFMRESSRDYYRQTNSLTQPDCDNMEDALVSAHGNELIPFGRYDSIVFSGDYVQGGTWTGRYKGSLTPDVDKIYHYSDSFQISDLLAGKGGTAPAEPLSPIKPSTGTTSSTEMPSVSVQFKDVCGSDYYADAVLWAVEKNITSGTSATTFSPGATCSKAQILAFLWRANGSPEPTAANPFTDIKPADYFYKAALWAAEKGLVSGSTFGANTDCTRAMTVEYL
jgi:hypothetical protein